MLMRVALQLKMSPLESIRRVRNGKSEGYAILA